MALNLFRRITSSGHFFKYHQFPKDLCSLQKQLIFRSSNLGMLELDIIVGNWAKEHIPSLSYDECLNYHHEVLQMETPYLIKYITGESQLPPNLLSNSYLKQLKGYALTPKNL